MVGKRWKPSSSSGPIRPGTRQRGILHARRLGLQIGLAPQLPGFAAGRTHGRRFGLRRTNRLRSTTRALRHRGGEFVRSFAFSRPPWLASGRAGLGGGCLGHVSARVIARLLVAWHRMADLGGRPQHDRAIDQIGFEPVATVQPKLLANGGWQRNPTVVVELDRRHESGLSGMLRTRRKEGCLPGLAL